MTSANGPGDSPERVLDDASEVLLRQVHPSFLQDGEPSSQAFVPTPKDEGQLSIARGSLTTAESAFLHYTTVLQKDSAGTWGVTVGEASGASLNSFDAPRPDVPAHGFIDFRSLSVNQARRKGQVLKGWARERGRIYP
jgi:hypothetical protein